MSYRERRDEAEALIADPTPLIEAFTTSIETFGSYDNRREGFYSNKARAPKKPDPLGQIEKTHHVAWYLSQQRRLEITDEPELNAEYVDYEIAPARETGGASFTDGGSWRSGIFVDLLLASCDDRTPIVAELKIRADKDPFTALIQMLAGVAHLATAHQYERLRTFAPAGAFPAAEQPRLDGYILLHRFLETPQVDLDALARKARALSALLIARTEVKTHLRRVACLDIDLADNGKLHATSRWSYKA